MNWFYIIIALVLVFAISAPLFAWAEDGLHGDGGHTRRTREFHHASRAAGEHYSQTVDNLYLREALARLRREASDKVLADPVMWFDGIGTAKADVLNAVLAERPDLVAPFKALIDKLSYGDILYPSEAEMVDREVGAGRHCRPSIDQIAALKIVKSG